MADGEFALGAVDTVDSPEPEVQDAPLETPEETPEPDAQLPTGDEIPESKEPEGGEKPAPVKTGPRDISKFVREMREAYPDRANVLKEMNDAYFRSQAYSQFGAPEEIQRLKANFEAIGGEEGIANLQQSAHQMQQYDEMAETGDPRIVDAWTKESPEGFKKVMPVALENLERLDPASYASTVQPHLIKALQGAGLGEALNRLAWYANKVDSPELKSEMGKITSWFNGLVENESKRAAGATDPRMAEIEKGRADLQTRSQQIFSKEVMAEVQPHMSKTIRADIARQAGGTKLGDKAIERIEQDVVKEINATLSKDKTYQANVTALRQKGEVSAVAKYIKQNVDSIRGRITREVWNSLPFQPTNAAKPAPRAAAPAKTASPAAPTQRQNSAPLLLPGKPKITDLDMDRDPDRMLFISGRGYLKTGQHAGKLVQWRKQA